MLKLRGESQEARMEYRTAIPTVALAALLTFATVRQLPAQETEVPAGYRGAYGTLGLDGGSGDCLEGSGCWKVLALHLRIGGRVSERFAFGLGANAFADSESDGSALYSLQALYYPFNRKLFALLGAGLSTGGGEAGAGLVLELGYDLPLNSSGSLAITPHAGLVLMTLDYPAGDYLYAGLGFTVK
jgi:hypothetical protein